MVNPIGGGYTSSPLYEASSPQSNNQRKALEEEKPVEGAENELSKLEEEFNNLKSDYNTAVTNQFPHSIARKWKKLEDFVKDHPEFESQMPEKDKRLMEFEKAQKSYCTLS